MQERSQAPTMDPTLSVTFSDQSNNDDGETFMEPGTGTSTNNDVESVQSWDQSSQHDFMKDLD